MKIHVSWDMRPYRVVIGYYASLQHKVSVLRVPKPFSTWITTKTSTTPTMLSKPQITPSSTLLNSTFSPRLLSRYMCFGMRRCSLWYKTPKIRRNAFLPTATTTFIFRNGDGLFIHNLENKNLLHVKF